MSHGIMTEDKMVDYLMAWDPRATWVVESREYNTDAGTPMIEHAVTYMTIINGEIRRIKSVSGTNPVWAQREGHDIRMTKCRSMIRVVLTHIFGLYRTSGPVPEYSIYGPCPMESET